VSPAPVRPGRSVKQDSRRRLPEANTAARLHHQSLNRDIALPDGRPMEWQHQAVPANPSPARRVLLNGMTPHPRY